MKKIIVGEILKSNKVIGTGFLVAPDIVITAKHNVLTADDILENENKEIDVVFRINNHDEVFGTTINLSESIRKGIDCVYICLDEILCENEDQVLVECENDITKYNCYVRGFPKLAQKEIQLEGKIVLNEEEITILINKEDQLQTYEGLSGAPLIVAENVVGIIIEQEDIKKLKALSIKFVIENLGDKNFKIMKRNIPNCLVGKVFNIYTLKQEVEQIITIVGPRYSENLNVKTDIYNELSFILKKDGVKKRLEKISNKIGDCIKKLVEYNQNEKDSVLDKNRNIISKMVIQLQEDKTCCDSDFYNEEQLNQIVSHMKASEVSLTSIFKIEKVRFEEKYGIGTFEDKRWRGFMASYRCAFPTRYLDELQDVIKLFLEIINMLDVDLISKAGSQAILISGRGGVGKTHLLCDIVSSYLKQGLPAVLLLGEFFKEDTTADSIIMNWYHKEEKLENFFSWLNEIGEQNNIYIPICIDAINEVNDKKYWNINLPLLLTKVKKYNNIKMIFSCRSIYLEEYLERDKISNLLQLEHCGFGEIEVEALSSFCEYYGVNINYNTIYVPEFMNPLFLKMLCEIAKEKKDKTVIVDDIKNLMKDFFTMKNKIISRHYEDYFSIRDNIVSLVLKEITDYMAETEDYSISWTDLRSCVSKILDRFGIKEKTSGFIKLLLSENLLRELDDIGERISFAYQKFYEYLYAQKYEAKSMENIVNAVENRKITLGTLEMIQIAYFRRNKDEFLNVLNEKIHREAVDSFISGFYWRNTDEINENTIAVIERLLTSSQIFDIRRVMFGLISVSTKINCRLNAFYIHEKLKSMKNIKRDYFFSFFLLKQYDHVKVISDLCERAIALKEPTFSEESVLLWKIMLCWGTSCNDIKLRDKSSKGLVNLFRLYPNDMLKVVKLFNDVNDDYIQERLWQAIYSTIIFLQKKEYALLIIAYIREEIFQNKNWPQNVLIRDFLRNIFEYSFYKRWISEEEVNNVRPPYKSKKHNVNKEFVSTWKDKFQKLYWNCQGSDFAIYTVPFEVEDYGLSKKNVGLMIFEDIVQSGYNEKLVKYDAYIDRIYGSLRNRDEQVERIGKKYQKIFLYREMGNIYDNYKYLPRIQCDEVEIIPSEQGNSFRKIDLTILNQENLFMDINLEYPFYRYGKWDDIKWFEYKDVEQYIPTVITTKYEEKEYYLFQGYLSSKEVGKKEFREVWMQIRTYLFSKDKKEELLKWFKKKDFVGRWMPEGFGQLYECCVGEYPWSPIMVNYLGQEDKQCFRQEKQVPCHLITTANDYILEKDSSFCANEFNSCMFPSKYMFEKMNLVWNGAFGYNANGQTVIFNGRNHTIFIEKMFLLDFLNKNKLDIIWTILGEKQKITNGLGREFPGRSEFSYTYYLDKTTTLIQNHEIYNVSKPERY
ncbi:hypothetical protein [Megamonas funiformis]|uniref:hypothetical protein n=1 Tax=Megamonas funiformis TaxID=437897 RepID=UPI002598B66D|nr:hypothetical protein [Megamonas funiformis]